jgi:hypothetical protein
MNNATPGSLIHSGFFCITRSLRQDCSEPTGCAGLCGEGKDLSIMQGDFSPSLSQSRTL